MGWNGRNVTKNSLPYTALPKATLDLRAQNIAGSYTRHATSTDGFGLVLRSMTSAERDAILVNYGTLPNPESPTTLDANCNGAVLYNTTTNAVQVRANNAWVTIGGAGGADTLQTAYDAGNTITLTAASSFEIADALATTIDAINITKSVAQGNATTGAGLRIDLDAAPVGTGEYYGYVFDATGFSSAQVEGVRLTMGAATNDAIHITSGAITVDAGALTLSAGVFAQTSAATTAIHDITASSVATGTASTRTYNGLTTGIGELVTSGGTINGNGILASFVASGLTSGTGISLVANTMNSGRAVSVTANGMTTGTLFYGESSAAGITTGMYLRLNDGAQDVFSVGAAGATIITGSAAGTDALTLTAGDILLSSGDIDLTDGRVTITQAQAGEVGLSLTANGARTVNAIQIDTNWTGNTIFADFNVTGNNGNAGAHVVNVDWGGGRSANCFNVVGTAAAAVLSGSAFAADIQNTSAATGAVFSGTISGAAAHSARVFNAVVSSATTTTGEAYRVVFSGGAHQGVAFRADMGTNLAGNGLLIARSGVTTGSSIVITHAGASTSAGGPDVDIDGTATATTWIGQRIRNAIVATATGRLLEVAQRGTGASTSNTLFSDDGTGSSATIAITQSAGKTGAAAAGLSITPSAPGANYRALLLDGTAGTTFTACDIIGGAVLRTTPLFDVQDAGTSTGNTFTVNVTGVGNSISNIFGVSVAGAYTGHVFQLSYGGAADSSAFLLSMNNAATTAQTWVSSDNRNFSTDAYSYTFSGAAVAADGMQLLATGAFDVNSNLMRLAATTGAFAGDVLNISTDGNAGVGAQGLVIDRGANAGTATFVTINDQTTGAGAAFSLSSLASTLTTGIETHTISSGVGNSIGALFAFTQRADGTGGGSVTSGLRVTGTQSTTLRNQGIFYAANISVDAGAALINTAGTFGALHLQADNLDGATTNVLLDLDDAGANLDAAIRAARGGINFITNAQNIVWTGIAAGLHVSAGQNIVIDANLAAAGTDTVTINNGTPGIILAGALRPTKSIWTPAIHFITGVTGAASSADTTMGSIRVKTFAFDPAAIETIDTSLQLPTDYVTNTAITVRLIWTNSAGGAGNVAWNGSYVVCAAGDLYSAAVTAFAAQVNTAAGAQYARVTTDLTISAAAALVVGKTLNLTIQRTATDGVNDTYASDALMVGVELRYTSNTP